MIMWNSLAIKEPLKIPLKHWLQVFIFFPISFKRLDPLLLPGTTWFCGVCSTYGYSVYLQNDPVFVNMELWNYTNTYPCGCTCSNNTCTNIPSNNVYAMASYCPTTVSCSSSFDGNCNNYFIGDSGRFGCNSKVTCCSGTNCINVKTIDSAPACQTEANYGAPTVMVSTGVCKHFTGTTKCGKSDHVDLICDG